MSSIPGIAALIYNQPGGERTVSLTGDQTTIGRLADQDLVLAETYVSRRHAIVQRQPQGYELLDQGSTHGCYVNGVRVQRALLHEGDVLQFGSPNAVKISFFNAARRDPEPDRPTAGNLHTSLSVLTLPVRDVRPGATEMEKLSFLLSAARQINAVSGITEILRVLLQSSIQLTGVERGFVFLREENQMRLALGLHQDGRVVDEDSTVSRRAMQRAIESEKSFSISDTMADSAAAGWDSVILNAIRSIYCIPLRKRLSSTEPSHLLGLLYLDSQLGAGSMSEIDHQVLDTVANEAANVLHNALLADAELKSRIAAEQLAIAARIHSGLMAITLPQLDYARLQAKTVPCLAIGGDFYDAVALDDGVCVAIADVSGKGVPASIVAATLQGILHALVMTGQSLPEIATAVNRFLCARNVGKYATMVLLKLFPDGRVEYVNCGHVPPLAVSASKVRRLTESNLVVGLIDQAIYLTAHDRLQPGERILLSTDGVTEAENQAGEQFGDEGLEAAVRLDNLDAILDRLITFQTTSEAQDDWTLLEVRYQGQR
jgi:serine phosphatase RsbU (regulator of sigma subunit)